MQNLKTSANIAKPDDIYEMLISAHNGLTKAESDTFNAKLILILMNQIGDETTIREALALAKTRVQIKSDAS
jgi:uncharacterized radical SAM superfamily protein